MKGKMALGSIVFALSFSVFAEGDLEKQQKALNIIADFAGRICNNIDPNGSSESLELSGSAKAELNGLLKKITNIGIEGAAKYQTEKYENVLQEDLAELIKYSSSCKQDVWNDLKDKLLTPAAPKVEKKGTKVFTRKFAFEDHHCSVKEERATNLCVDPGYEFKGIVGEPAYSSKDKCGSQFLSFNPNPSNKQCGVFKVKLVGCGHDWLKTCKGHAWIKGSVKLSGEK